MAGRAFEAAPAPRELQPLEPESIAPLNSDGHPDLMNYMPFRLVPLDEAKQRGWPLFYQAETCRYGHSAPRYVSNPRQCVDCFRLKRGKTLLSAAPTTPHAEYKRQYSQRTVAVAVPGQALATIAVPPEPDRLEKRFLSAYAHTKDLDVAAVEAGMSGAQVIARMSWSAVFAAAVKALEDTLNLKHIPMSAGPYDWDPSKRTRLIEVFIDTGDVATARDSIRVTPSEYFRELERNPDFAAQIDEAAQLAMRALEDRATQLALAGNDKLLQKLLAAKMPEYRDRVDVNMKHSAEKLTDDQLNAQLTRLVGKYSGRIIDAEYRSVESAGQDPLADDPEGDRATPVAESNSDLL